MSILFTVDLGNPESVANALALSEDDIAALLTLQKRFGNMSQTKAAGLSKRALTGAREQFEDGPWQKQKDAVTEALGFYPFRGGKAPADELALREQIAADGHVIDYGQPWQRFKILEQYGYVFKPLGVSAETVPSVSVDDLLDASL